jgi:putative ABC transport system permease protein
VVAVAGIVIGNAMTAATLAGRTFSRQVLARRDEVEAWLALGATPRVAHADVARESARESLLPTLDQTRATGLVTLPGAFVGALFGGASPAVAAQFQLVVLAAIMLAMTVTSLVVTRLAATEPTVPLPSRT